MPKKCKTIIALILILTLECIGTIRVNGDTEIAQPQIEAEPIKTIMYAADGRTMEVTEDEVNIYLNLNWYLEPMTIVYGRYEEQRVIKQADVQGYIDTHYWTSEPQPKVIYAEVVLLAKIINAEAAANSDIDKQYVGRVVINRINNGYWGNTLSKVIYAKGQYGCLRGNKFKQNPPDDCLEIAYQCLRGTTYGVPNNVIFQAQFKQGKGLWKKVGVHYYCYG